MLSTKELYEIIKQAPNENDHWDFKKQWYKTDDHVELIRDIMNFVNTPHHDDCYIILGIDDNGKVLGVNDDKNRKNRQQLQDLLRKQPFAQNSYPRTDVSTYKVYSSIKDEYVEIDVLTIFNENNVPIFLESEVFGSIIMKNGKKRFGLDLNIFDRFKRVLCDKQNWFYSETESIPKYIYQVNPDFVIEEVIDRDSSKAHFVSWAQSLMNVRVDIARLKLMYRGIDIKEYPASIMNGARFIACDPESSSINNNVYCFYIKNKLNYLINEMIDFVHFPNTNWEGYTQFVIKKEVVVYDNNRDRRVIENNPALQDQLNLKYKPGIEEKKNLARKINNNIESGDALWNTADKVAEEFLKLKHNAQVISDFKIANSIKSSSSENDIKGTMKISKFVGNINSRIYHVPGQIGYNVNPANIIYFKNEQEAIDKGYRKAKRQFKKTIEFNRHLYLQEIDQIFKDLAKKYGMKVWTIQPQLVWLQLKKHGVYYANENLSYWLRSRDHLLEEGFNITGWISKWKKRFHYLLKV